MKWTGLLGNILILTVALACLSLVGCVGVRSKRIAIDGSSTVFPITEAIAEEYQKEKHGTVHVTVGISGTGGGFKKFVRGETDVQDASRPILAEEMELAKKNGIEYLELPVCFDALSVVVSIKNDFCDEISIDELKTMWEPAAQGKVKKWSEIRPGWPDAELRLYGAGSDSGTFDYFTEAVVGKAKSSRGDYTASEDDHVLVQGLSNDPHALGYIPYSYLAANADKIRSVKVRWSKNKVKDAVAPNKANILRGIYNPLSRPLFIYVSRKSLENKPEVAEFVAYYLDNVARLSAKVKYVPLPLAANEQLRNRFDYRKYGTGFGGKQEVGLPIGELLKREPQ